MTARSGSRAGLDKDPADIARMFDEVADRYDRMNAVMTFGQERRWRHQVARALRLRKDARILDLAAGTGASTAPFAVSGARPVACDFSLGMLTVGKKAHPNLDFVAGDALRLPFRDGAFDAVTISFGLRNVADLPTALRELARVTRPGGRLVVLETSQPPARLLRAAGRVYTERVMPRIARLFSSDPAAYGYLAESAGAWLDQKSLAAALRDAGWTSVRWQDLMFGSVAIHCADKPQK
jgi:demethylmenaquinone methyltransferase/2-methoxy-6-polyprenyl-1,4-benzoquinol methylase